MFSLSRVIIVIFFFVTTACASNVVSEKEQKNMNPNVSYCKEPRPQLCTMEYAPVCGLVANKAVKTYGNACSACGDINVKQYVKGECQSDALERFLDGTIEDSSAKMSVH